MDKSVVIAVSVLCVLGTVCGQNNRICASQQKCSDCISQPECIWCVTPNYNPNTHCVASSQIDMNTWCALDKLFDPDTYYEVTDAKQLNSGKIGEAIQITPQQIKVRPRRGVETNIRFQYVKANNYPINNQSLNATVSVLGNNKIASAVRITDNASSSIEIKYHSSCSNPTENGCTNLQLNEVVHVTATLKALECVKGSNIHSIQIRPEGINEALMVRLEVICSCDCEKPGNSDFIENPPECHNNGNATCGVCSCAEKHFGSNCECYAESASMVDENNCKSDSKLPELCSGFGICKCGKCICNERSDGHLIYGKYCECNDFSCRRVGGKLCGGPDRGRCSCGVCECFPGWMGEACECQDTIDTCIAPDSSGEICSGRGNCVCGSCVCHNDRNKYFGRYCEECASCQGQRCEEFRACVECQAYATGLDAVACMKKCVEFNTVLVDTIDENSNEEHMQICTVLDSTDCRMTFRYGYVNQQSLTVEALTKKACPEPVNNIFRTLYGYLQKLI